VISVLAGGIIYGTDVFSAIVLRPALALVDDRTLVSTMGREPCRPGTPQRRSAGTQNDNATRRHRRANADRACCDPPGSESLTCRSQGACSLAPIA